MSDPDSPTLPSTQKQLALGEYLKQECLDMGLSNVRLTRTGYVYATLPANTDKEIPSLGFIAHMDTSPDLSGKEVKPRIVRDYDGGDIVLNQGKEL